MLIDIVFYVINRTRNNFFTHRSSAKVQNLLYEDRLLKPVIHVNERYWLHP